MYQTSKFAMAAVAVFAVWAAPCSAEHDGKGAKGTIHKPDGLKWQTAPPSLPAGVKIALLEGDPAKPGPFVFRVKFPDGARVMPHFHPKPERVTVISGTLYIGMGDKFDAARGREMPAGHVAYARPAAQREPPTSGGIR